MGQKVNPHGLRVGIIKDWDSKWYADSKNFGDSLVEDYNVRKYLKKTHFDAGVAKIEIENYGTIELELYGKEAPLTVDNFAFLANIGFYNGLTFHRVIDGFMAQGGDPEGTGCGGSDENIKGEFRMNGVNNTLSHTRGVISMARSQNPNSASSQFFIMHADAASLDGQYAAFGNVTDGMDVVEEKRSRRSHCESAVQCTR